MSEEKHDHDDMTDPLNWDADPYRPAPTNWKALGLWLLFFAVIIGGLIAWREYLGPGAP